MTTAKSNEITQADQKWLASQVDALTFGEAIKAFRECEELSQSKVAIELGITTQMLSAYENGRKLPSLRKAYEIANVLGMDAETTVLILVNEQMRRDNIPLKVEAA